MRNAVPALVLLFCSGCACHHPLLSDEQRSRIKHENQYLVSNRAMIYGAIEKDRKIGALVVVPNDLSSVPKVFPGQSPVHTLIEDKQAFETIRTAATGSCLFVFSQDTPSDPIRRPCQLFFESARSIRELKSESKVFAAALAPTMALVEFNSTQTDALEKQMKTVSGALATSSATQKKANDLLKDTIEKFAQTYSALREKLDEISKNLDAIK